MHNFTFYNREHDPDMRNGYKLNNLNELNHYFAHSNIGCDIHDVILKAHGMHYETRNTLFQVYSKKLGLIGYLELLK